ncbi:MAG: minor capsid protein [Fusobacteriaceae bacterium]|nr:minor capsid protein [Fusobacteriaceae bacterium]MBN2838026.1 minor capsid protein [Fusobacteriaceae bacterium]
MEENKNVHREVATRVLDSLYTEFEYKFDYEDIKQMVKDLDIATAINTTKRSICAKELNLVAYKEENQDKIPEIESRLNFKKLNGLLENIIESKFFGYSISEIVYKEDFTFDVKPKSRDLFDYDISNKKWYYKSDDGQVFIDEEKFLITINNNYKAYRGESILYELFKDFQIKRELDKKLSAIINRYGDRVIWFIYDPNADEEDIKDQAENLKKAKDGYAIGIPAGSEAENGKQFGFITMNDLKTEIHTQLLSRYEKKIDKYLLGNTLAQNENSGTGSYAQSQTHAEQQSLVITDMATYVEEELRKLLEIDAKFYNYDPKDFYPKLSDKIDIDEEIEREKKKKEVEKEEANILSIKMDSISKLSQAGYKLGIDELKEFLGFNTLEEVTTKISEFEKKKDKIEQARELRKKYEESLGTCDIEMSQINSFEDIENININLNSLEEKFILGILQGYANVKVGISEFEEKINPFDLKFDDAIKYFIDVERIGYDFINEVQSDVYDNFKYILDNTNLEVQLKLLNNIQKNLAIGGTFKDWLANSKDEIEKIGLGKNGSYFETVYRTNMQTAYSVGQYKAQIGIKKTHPNWLYDGVIDGREQDHTKMYDGKIWRADDPIWNSIYPPNGYNCRCNVISLTEEDIESMGETIQNKSKKFESDARENLGKFAFNPAKNYWESIKKSGIIKKKNIKEVKKTIENINFEQIKTTKELEEYVKTKNLSDIVDLKDIHIDYAKEWIKGIEENYKKIPELRNNMKFIGSIQGRNRKLLEIEIKKNYEKYKLLANKYGVTDEKQIKKSLEKKIRTSIGRVSSKDLAQSWKHPDVGGVTLNNLNFSEKNDLLFLKKGVLSKFYPEGCETINYILDHELGHEIDNLLFISDLDEIKNLFSSMSNDEITSGLSTYAWNNSNRNPIREFVAEAWAEYLNNKKPRQIASTVGKIIEEEYLKWTKSKV